MRNLFRRISEVSWVPFAAGMIVGLALLVTAASTLQLIGAAVLLFGIPALRVAAAYLGRQEIPRPSTDKLPDLPTPPGGSF